MAIHYEINDSELIDFSTSTRYDDDDDDDVVAFEWILLIICDN